MDRRQLLTWIIRGSAGIMAAATVIPGLGMLIAPVLERGQKKKRRVVLPDGERGLSDGYVQARLEGQEATAPSVFVRREPDGSVVAISGRCTHAGCAIQWRERDRQFLCPCHKGRYDDTGKNIAGPPPRPLDRLKAEIVAGEVFVEEPQA